MTSNEEKQRVVKRWLIIILIIAFTLRLAYGLGQNTNLPYRVASDDSSWYLAYALALATDAPPGTVINSWVTDVRVLGPPPVYFLFIGIPQALFAPDTAITVIRLLQAALGALTCAWAAGIAWRFVPNWRALIPALALALAPVFIMEAAQIKTETVYIALLMGGLWTFVEAVQQERRLAWLAGAALLFGLATLTRAVLLGFPLLLALFLLVVLKRGRGRGVAVFLLVYAVTVGTWTVYNLARYDRFVIAGDGLAAFLYLGATGWDDPESVDERLENALALQATPTPEETALPDATAEMESTGTSSEERQTQYLTAAGDTILSNIPAYVARRVGELGSALVQPHGTLFFPGSSLRDLVAEWWQTDRTLNGLGALTAAEGFWGKLVLYGFHFTALGLGVVGAIVALRRGHWRVVVPMLLFIGYTLVVHLALYALPRYLFPTLVVWVVLAAGVWSIDSLTPATKSPPSPISQGR